MMMMVILHNNDISLSFLTESNFFLQMKNTNVFGKLNENSKITYQILILVRGDFLLVLKIYKEHTKHFHYLEVDFFFMRSILI